MNCMGQPTGNWLCGVSVTGVRSARDSLGLHFIDNSSIHVTTWLVMGYI